MKNSELSLNAIKARVNSEGERLRLASKSLRSRTAEDHSSDPLDAVIGIRNGVIGGIMIYLLAYFSISLFY